MTLKPPKNNDFFNRFTPQDPISNSPYCLSYNSYEDTCENFVWDQQIIP